LERRRVGNHSSALCRGNSDFGEGGEEGFEDVVSSCAQWKLEQEGYARCLSPCLGAGLSEVLIRFGGEEGAMAPAVFCRVGTHYDTVRLSDCNRQRHRHGKPSKYRLFHTYTYHERTGRVMLLVASGAATATVAAAATAAVPRRPGAVAEISAHARRCPPPSHVVCGVVSVDRQGQNQKARRPLASLHRQVHEPLPKPYTLPC
jgi:hypothetical protein